MPQDTPKVALVTGAARGIGLATAKRFLEEGWAVALLDIEAATLEATRAEIARPEATLALPCDVSDPVAVEAAFAVAGAAAPPLQQVVADLVFHQGPGVIDGE